MITSTRFLMTLMLSLAINVVVAQNKFISDSLDIYVNREMKRWQVPGLAVVVVKEGKIVAMKGYGVRVVGKPEKVDENTLFQIASNTKAFTGTCVSLLNYQKKLTLDDKVTKWLPGYKLYDELATRDVSVRDVLCHRVGFRTFQGDFLNWNCNLPTDSLVKKLQYLKPVYGFRERFGYFNMGFVTAGEVIESVTDTTWQDYMTTHLLKPLQMNNSTPYYATFANNNNKATCYTIYNDSLVKVPYANIDNIGASASIGSSVSDLSHWVIMQLDSGRYNGKQIVPYDVIRETRRSQSLVGDRGKPSNFMTYGLGWFIEDYNGKKTIHHGGGTNGFVTKTVLCPEEKLGIIVLTNTDANDLYTNLAYQILESYLNMPYRNLSAEHYSGWRKQTDGDNKSLNELKAKTNSNQASSLALEKYTGTYRNEYYGDIQIKKERNDLVIYFSHHQNMIGYLKSLGENNFLCTYSDLTAGIKEIPFTVKDNKVQSVTIRVNDFIDYMPYEFKKVE